MYYGFNQDNAREGAEGVVRVKVGVDIELIVLLDPRPGQWSGELCLGGDQRDIAWGTGNE